MRRLKPTLNYNNLLKAILASSRVLSKCDFVREYMLTFLVPEKDTGSVELFCQVFCIYNNGGLMRRVMVRRMGGR